MHLSQITNPALTNDVQNLESPDFFSRLLSTLVTGAFVIGGIVFTFMLLIGGVQWITSGGDKGKLEEARNRITHALVGLIILFITFVIVNAVESIFNINLLNIDIDPLIIR